MKIINPSVEVEPVNGYEMLNAIERAGRTCYQSEAKSDTAIPFIKGLINRGHFSVLEHEKLTARVICDRGVSHEIVRHRIGSYSQESTRYCNYKGHLVFIKPCFWEKGSPQYNAWAGILDNIERVYDLLINNGAKPEEARAILPNSLKTEIVITYNLREWRHFFELRCAKTAHPQIREVAVMLLKKMKEMVPIVFDDFKINDWVMTAQTTIKPAS